jgi:hypothetical protein
VRPEMSKPRAALEHWLSIINVIWGASGETSSSSRTPLSAILVPRISSRTSAAMFVAGWIDCWCVLTPGLGGIGSERQTSMSRGL